MKKPLLYCLTALFIFGFMPAASAMMVDFTYPFAGIDDDTSSWSSDDSMVNLDKSISVLNGIGTVYGYRYKKWSSEWAPTYLSQRGTRGLGVNPCWFNERDEINKHEMIIVSFSEPQYLNFFEVRSLFKNDYGWSGIEEGEMYGYLNETQVLTEHMQGKQGQGTNGILSYSYNNPHLIDTLKFTVLPNQSYSCQSEFALAKFDVTPVPEPATLSLLSLGILGFGFARKKGD